MQSAIKILFAIWRGSDNGEVLKILCQNDLILCLNWAKYGYFELFSAKNRPFLEVCSIWEKLVLPDPHVHASTKFHAPAPSSSLLISSQRKVWHMVGMHGHCSISNEEMRREEGGEGSGWMRRPRSTVSWAVFMPFGMWHKYMTPYKNLALCDLDDLEWPRNDLEKCWKGLFGG